MRATAEVGRRCRVWISVQRERLARSSRSAAFSASQRWRTGGREAPLYNPSGTVDPWLYTALWVNFDQIYEHFGNTYYASRLPWIVPGRIPYGVLPVDAAYWVFHGLAFVGGVTALFVLVRRHLGLALPWSAPRRSRSARCTGTRSTGTTSTVSL